MATNSTPVATNNISLVPPCTIPLTGVLRYTWTPGSPAPFGFVPEVRIALMGTTVPGAQLNVYVDPVTGRTVGAGNAASPRAMFGFLPTGTQPSPTVAVAAVAGDTFLNLSSVSNMTAYNDYSVGPPDTNLMVYSYIGGAWADISTGGTAWQATTVPGDAIYFQGDAAANWNHIKHVVNTAAATLQSTLVMQWQYHNGSTWADLTPYLTGDQTDATKATPSYHLGCLPAATGTMYTGWRSPSDWAAVEVGAAPVSAVLRKWVRCVCLTGGTIGTRPVTNAQYTGRLHGTLEWAKPLSVATLTAVPVASPLEYAHGATHVVHPASTYPGVVLDGTVPYQIIVGNTAASGSPLICEIVAATLDSYLNQ